jgi:hypothetical protein
MKELEKVRNIKNGMLKDFFSLVEDLKNKEKSHTNNSFKSFTKNGFSEDIVYEGNELLQKSQATDTKVSEECIVKTKKKINISFFN